MPVSVGLISLGCAKNLIDSEIMAGHLKKAGMILTKEPDLADVVIVNTCSFIDKAKQESIDTILGVAQARLENAARKDQKLIVAGCLSQKFSKELPSLLPEVDLFIGLDQITQVSTVIEELFSGNEKSCQAKSRSFVTKHPAYIPDYDTPRFRLTPPHSAYVKIAEGCNHLCSFCAIPQIRGRHRSRTQESVVREVRALVAAGVKEINLISQDTTYFGMDRWTGQKANRSSKVDSTRGESLTSLIFELDKIEGEFWIRLLYTHPAHWSEELIEAINSCQKVVPYVDIPLQHISDNMLGKMRRETDGKYIRELLAKMRKSIPNLALRTAFIVGFPGETEEDFDELIEFIKEQKFERGGIFQYSGQDGTKSAKLDDQVPEAVALRRFNEATAAMSQSAEAANRARLGSRACVLVEESGIARSILDAPEIDGSVFVDANFPVGQFAEVILNESNGVNFYTEIAQTKPS